MPRVMKKPMVTISTSEGMKIVLERRGHNITKATMINWCKKYKLGRQIGKGSPWEINKDKLIKLLDHGGEE